jgi:hypothetical protein
LPKEAWDASTPPPLPRSILVPTTRRTSRPRPWVRHPWCPELGWVASQPALSETQHNDLVAVNKWLIHNRGRDVPVVPMRYRSVELLGNEKHLEALSRTSLFAPGRLNLDLLCCVRRPLSLAAAAIGRGTDALVIENSDTYWAAIDILRHLDGHPVGIIAWRAGRAFPTQAETLKIEPPRERWSLPSTCSIRCRCASDADQRQTDASMRAMLPPAMPAVSFSSSPALRSARVSVGKSRSPW